MKTSERRSVLISGASSGIGFATATRLAQRGFSVFAGFRRDADGDALAAIDGVTPILLDIESDAHVLAAVRQVGGALHGLVNNAGISVRSPIETVRLEDLRRAVEVNAIAQVRVIQAALPALRNAGGRIVNVTSVAGRLALPLAGPYSASKYAFEAISDSLRRELAPEGIRVVVVQPGATRSNIWNHGRLETAAILAGDQRYAARGRRFGDILARAERGAIDPDRVAAVIERALTSRFVAPRYRVGPDARVALGLADWLPDRVLDFLTARMM